MVTLTMEAMNMATTTAMATELRLKVAAEVG